MTALRLFRPDRADYRDSITALRNLLRAGELTSGASSGGKVADVVRGILEQVARGGDEAAARLTSELDRAKITPETLRVPSEVLERAHRAADPDLMGLVRRAAANVRAYQQHILLRSPEPLERDGRRLGVRYTPLRRVAVYVPGGRALYPSTVVMTVVPALVAGVREIAMFSPPTGGEIADLALALAWELGVHEVYRLGGAVGLAAAAFGTASVKPVDKIVGPGNAYVAEAKRQLFGKVGIDSIAGPSEVFIVADDSANPRWLAADLIAQAEHDPGSAILATPSSSLAEAVLREVERELESLERADAARRSLERYGAVIVTRDLDEACVLANEFATEHLQIITRDDDRCLERIEAAGAIFVGAHTPVPLGDYYAGPSHVLPTGGTARFSAPLSANDFLKVSSLIRYQASDLAADTADVMEFARREGLTAHARAVGIRGER
ncbi:MAG TPA: histidinol dehydrogenase [Polyangiaceae bacterium]|nr:histidinol dehydrogenase [Polyangiaceae bacterium]